MLSGLLEREREAERVKEIRRGRGGGRSRERKESSRAFVARNVTFIVQRTEQKKERKNNEHSGAWTIRQFSACTNGVFPGCTKRGRVAALAEGALARHPLSAPSLVTRRDEPANERASESA